MHLYRTFTDGQFQSNLAVQQTGGGQSDDFLFALRQPFEILFPLLHVNRVISALTVFLRHPGHRL